MTFATTQIKVQSKVVALFVSDIHLTPKLPRTTHAFIELIDSYLHQTENLFLLGDLFEYWAGDDDRDTSYHQKIITTLKKMHNSGTNIYWIAGNRDFLIGKEFAKEAGMNLLNDPSCFTLANRSFLITHGDAQCTDDIAYMQFRNMVRQEKWQLAFLSKPLQERKAIIEQMREASTAGQKQKSMAIMDVNQQAINQLFVDNHVNVIIHGHTHRPALHRNENNLRYVLPDWDCDQENEENRGGWLTLNEEGQFLFHSIKGKTSEDWKHLS